MRFAAAGILLFAALAAAGCASNGPYWSREDRGTAERLELEERIAGLEKQLAAAGDRNAALQTEVDALRRELEQQRSAAAPAASPAPEGIEPSASTPAARARPEIEQSDLGDLEGPADPGEVEAHEPAAAPAEPAEPAAATGSDDSAAQELYDRSLDFLQQQRLAEATEGFTQFLAANPDSDLADNAQFWLAECALRRGETDAALDAFRAVVERFPEGNKVPDALLKVGFCLAALGEPASAGEVYREILSRFPESAAAETARQRLAAP